MLLDHNVCTPPSTSPKRQDYDKSQVSDSLILSISTSVISAPNSSFLLVALATERQARSNLQECFLRSKDYPYTLCI